MLKNAKPAIGPTNFTKKLVHLFLAFLTKSHLAQRYMRDYQITYLKRSQTLFYLLFYTFTMPRTLTLTYLPLRLNVIALKARGIVTS